MKRSLLVPLAFLLAACGSAKPEVVVVKVTSTPRPVTATPSPTHASLPTNTPEPTHTPTPAWEPIEIAELDTTLGNEGYRRNPIKTGSGLDGFIWVKESVYERLFTWENGTIRFQVLHDRSSAVRSEHMEQKLMVLDRVFPAGFMEKLREEHKAFNNSLGATVSGEPEEMYNYGDAWKTIEAEYNVVETEIGEYYVRFSLWWWQCTCPPNAEYCYYDSFPGLEFTGDSSFTFHTILLVPYD